MQIIKKIISFFKIYRNQKIKVIAEQKNVSIPIAEQDDFINDLKEQVIHENKNKKVETLVCYGDGLGIQTKISS